MIIQEIATQAPENFTAPLLNSEKKSASVCTNCLFTLLVSPVLPRTELSAMLAQASAACAPVEDSVLAAGQPSEPGA
jgi:hypothetical protein